MWKFIKQHSFIVLCWFVMIVSGIVLWEFGTAIARVISARAWNEHECLIKMAKIDSNRGNTRIAVEYEYVVGQATYASSRYKFFPGYTSSHKVLPPELAPGKRVTCFVDPHDPASAVIVRGMTWDMLFGLIPLLFFGLFGACSLASVCVMFKIARAKWRRRCAGA